MTTPATSLRTAARRFQVGMHVDRAWRDHPEVTAAQYAVLVAATSRGQGRVVTARLATIAAALGRRSERAGDQVSAALVHLEKLGVLERSRTRRGAGVTCLRIRRAAGGYDVVPWELLRAVEAGEVEAGVLRTWACLSEKLGAYGWTRDTRAELAVAAHITPRTLQKHLAQLEGTGLITRIEGDRRHAIARAGATYTPAPGAEAVHSPAHPSTGPGEGGVANAGSPPVADSGSMYLAPVESLTPDFSSSRSDRHLGEREAHATSGRKRPSRGGIYAVEGISDVAELLGTDPAWRHGVRRRWLNGILAQAVHPALESGLTPEAIAQALLTDAEVLEMADLEQPLVKAAQAAITVLRIDIRDHQRCRDCGRSRNELDDARLTGRRCSWCHEQHHPEASEISDEDLQAIHAHLADSSRPANVVDSSDTDTETTNPTQENPTQEQIMTVTVGTQSRLTREVLESATPQQRAEILAQRVEQVERLRHLEASQTTDAPGPAPVGNSQVLDRVTVLRERWPAAASELEAERPQRRGHVATSDERRRAQRRRAQERRRAGAPSARVDASRARQHLQALHGLGYSAAVLSGLCDVDPGTVRNLLLDPETHPRAARLIGRELEQQVLDAEFDLDLVPESSHVPAEPTRRRVRALAAIGWSLANLAEQTGVTEAAVSKAAHAGMVQAGVARRYRDVYAELENSPGPSDRARREAQKRGWVPPAAWENIDDLNEQPAAVLRPSERSHICIEDLQDCVSWGLDVVMAAERLGVTKDAVEACARRAGHRDILDRLRANGIERSVA